jgi:hypothetical protein
MSDTADVMEEPGWGEMFKRHQFSLEVLTPLASRSLTEKLPEKYRGMLCAIALCDDEGAIPIMFPDVPALSCFIARMDPRTIQYRHGPNDTGEEIAKFCKQLEGMSRDAASELGGHGKVSL